MTMRQPLFTSLLFTGASTSEGRQINCKQFIEHGANILVSTPGRLVDVVQKGPNDLRFDQFIRALRSLEVLILDEADFLLAMGLEKQLNIILQFLPKQRRTGLFSATQTSQIEDLVRAGLRNSVRVVVREQTGSDSQLNSKASTKKGKKDTSNALDQRTPTTLQNHYLVVQPDEKLLFLVNFLLSNPQAKVLAFFATCACVDYFSRLIRLALPRDRRPLLLSLHGKQGKRRTETFNAFRSQPHSILFCTDVMARGVDIPDVDWVIQCDPPTSATAFVHRCGRTARCGAFGRALILLNESELAYVNFLKLNQKVMLEELPGGELISLTNKSPQSIKSAASLVNQLRCFCRNDKLLYEKSIRAFVSFIQFYRKHECHLLLNLKDLDLGALANGFGLLKLPFMPELKSADTSSFNAPPIDIGSLKYKDNSVANQRVLAAAAKAENPAPVKNKIQNKPWSKSQAVRECKKSQLGAKRSRKRKLPDCDVISTKPDQLLLSDGELDELTSDYRELKKSRRQGSKQKTASITMPESDSD